MNEHNNDMHRKRIGELPAALPKFLEDCVPKCIPAHRPVYPGYDLYDIAKKRI